MSSGSGGSAPSAGTNKRKSDEIEEGPGPSPKINTRPVLSALMTRMLGSSSFFQDDPVPRAIPSTYEGLLKMYNQEMKDKRAHKQLMCDGFHDLRRHFRSAMSAFQLLADNQGFDTEQPESSGDEADARANSEHARAVIGPRLNFCTMLDLNGVETACFNEYRELYKHEAIYRYGIKDHSEIVNEEQISEILPKLQSALRHGSPICPAPLCLYYCPITRITNQLIFSQRESKSFVPSVAQVMQICLKAWDHKNADFVFEIYVANHETEEQEVYIRANPASRVRHSISPSGVALKKVHNSGAAYKTRWASPVVADWVQAPADTKPSPNSGALPNSPLWWEDKKPKDHWTEAGDPWENSDKSGAWKNWKR